MADKHIKQCQALAMKLRKAGYSVPELKRAVDAYEKKLEEQEAKGEDESAPEGLSQAELNRLNFDRAFEGKAPLSPAGAGDRVDTTDQHRDLSPQRVAGIELERAVFGTAPMSAQDLARANLRRAASLDDGGGEHAPKGFNKVRLAKINIERASKGEPELLPHPDDMRSVGHDEDDSDEE